MFWGTIWTIYLVRTHPTDPPGSSGIAQSNTHKPRNKGTARAVGSNDSLTNRQVLLSTRHAAFEQRECIY